MAKYLALASNEEELAPLKEFLEKNLKEDEKAVIVFHSLVDFPSTEVGKKSSRIELKLVLDFLEEKDFGEIKEKAGAFARQWYRFDKGFEKEATIDGINLGLVYENDLFYFFNSTFMFLETVLKAIGKIKPKTIVANRNSFAGTAINSISKAKNLKNVKLLDFNEEKKFIKFPNLTRKKVIELRKKLPRIMEETSGNGESAKATVFIRSRGYLGDFERKLREAGELKVVSLDNFLVKRILNPINAYKLVSTKKKWAKYFRKSFAGISHKNSFKKMFKFRGINFFSLFESRAVQMTGRDWPEFVFLISQLSDLYKTLKPNALVLWEDSVPFERICALLARKHKTKSVVMQHGIFRTFTEKGKWIHGTAPVVSDKIAVWGKQFENALMRHQVPKSKIVITGAPRFDTIYHREFYNEETRKKLGVKKNEKLIALGTSCDLDNNELKQILKAVTSENGRKLAIKIHHIEDLKDYDWLKGKANVTQKGDLYSLLSASDAVIVRNSTVGFEAMIMKKPVIVFGNKLNPTNAYYSTNAVLRARDEKELETALKSAFDAKKVRSLRQSMVKFVYDFGFEQDGKATQRVIGLVKKMAFE